MLRLWLTISILLSITAHAAEPMDAIPLLTQSQDNLVAIPRPSAKQCEEILRPIADPAQVIDAGLKAIESASSQGERSKCLSDLVDGWDELVPALKVSPRSIARITTKNDPELHDLTDRLDKLDAKLACTADKNPPAEESKFVIALLPKHCEGKLTLDPFRGEMLEQRTALAKQIELRREVLFAMDRFAFQTADNLLPQPKAEIEEVNKLGLRISCMEDPSFFMCRDHGQEKGPLADLKKQHAALVASLNALNAKRIARQEALKGLLSYPEESRALLDLAALKEAYFKLSCIRFGTSFLSASCQAQGLPMVGDQSPLLEKLRAIVPNAEAIADAQISKKAELQKLRTTKDRASTREAEADYGLRRLLALFHAYSKGEKEEKDPVGKFCQLNEAMQKRDRLFAESLGDLQPLSTKDQWRWASEYGATEAEITAVNKYTRNHYGIVNKAIWAAGDKKRPVPLDAPTALFRDTLNSALAKASPYVGTVKRFSPLPKEVLAQHQVGKVITYDAFTSTSRVKNWKWDGDEPQANHRFVIYSAKQGKAVDSLSSSAEEQEVLFPAGTRFKVLSRKLQKGKPGLFEFVLAEVDEMGRVIGKAEK